MSPVDPALDRLVSLWGDLVSHGDLSPKRLTQAKAIRDLQLGASLDEVSAETGLTKRYLRKWSAAWDFERWINKKSKPEERLKRARTGIAQMMLGFLGEEHFLAFAHNLLAAGDFVLTDERSQATDTDHRLLDREGHVVCRINVKFHGTLFRESKQTVGLEPEDCFALATYKIFSALERQRVEAVPYLFLVVTVPSLPRAFVEKHLGDDLVWLASMSGRAVEEQIARYALRQDWAQRLHADIRTAEFRVLSASRAAKLMHQNLFERVFALRVPGFNRSYRGAEVDMHLSLGSEMISFRQFISLIRERGIREAAIRLDRGEI